MSFDQGEFDFDTPQGESGYLRWKEELEARKRAFELRWGVILGRKVWLQLRGFDKSIEGVIHLHSQKQPRHGRALPVLSIGRVDFTADEIESIVMADDHP